MKRILLTNDDGYHSPGLLALLEELKKLGDVTVVAPDRQRSALGHTLNFRYPVRVDPQEEGAGYRIYSADGSPTDCVMLGICHFVNPKPDLVVSGINDGPNLAYDITYSGTVAGALEGCIYGISSMSVSIGNHYFKDFQPSARLTREIAKKILENPLPEGVFLNINIPPLPLEEIKGFRFTFQGKSIYKPGVEKRRDPRGREYYWIMGEYPRWEDLEGSDYHALSRGYVSLTPLSITSTHRDFLDKREGIITELENIDLIKDVNR